MEFLELRRQVLAVTAHLAEQVQLVALRQMHRHLHDRAKVRDIDVISAGTFPIYAAGVTHRGPYKDGPGEINVPIAIDGMVIQPGDLMLRRDSETTLVQCKHWKATRVSARDLREK